jgi:DNA-binding transcriptional LysR family regulator
MAVVASPQYFAEHPPPQVTKDLMAHRCINQRMLTSGGLYVWDFERRGRKVNVRVDGPLIFNTSPPQVDAALAGLGVALLPEDEVMAHVEGRRFGARAGRLVPEVRRLSPLLSEPAAAVARLFAGGRGAAVSRLIMAQ